MSSENFSLGRMLFRVLRTGWLVSLIVHMGIIFTLAFIRLPKDDRGRNAIVADGALERPQEFSTETLDFDLTPAVNLPEASLAAQTFDTTELESEAPEPEISEEIADSLESPDVQIDDIEMAAFAPSKMVEDFSEEVLGQATASAADNAGAVDRITTELSQILWQKKALVVWLFDQSGSMKDDRQQIRQRVSKIYQELGLSGAAKGDELLTAVVSFGETVVLHTQKPTADPKEVMKAIGDVPVDASGEEAMCRAIAQAIKYHTQFLQYDLTAEAEIPQDDENADPKAEATGEGPAVALDDSGISFAGGGQLLGERKLILILVTDESGNRDENLRYIEDTIEAARAARCRVYVLGREASFNHPYDRVTITNPSTKQSVSVNVDRGPEDPLPEVLQTTMFGTRYDIRPSGFGPYEQSRLARSTGGIFFMLPSAADEKDGETYLKQRQDRLTSVRSYLPDLTDRKSYVNQIERLPLRKAIMTIVGDLNPWDKKTGERINLRTVFSVDPKQYQKQVRDTLDNAKFVSDYYDSAIARLERMRPLRDQESSRRWQANYDLLLAELTSYRLRTRQFEQVLEPTKAQMTPKKDGKTNQWRIRTIKETLGSEKIKPDVEEATERLQFVIDTHPGTPWASRAAWELGRGFGIELYEHFQPETKPQPPAPKL